MGNTAVKKGLHNNGVGFARCRGALQVGAGALAAPASSSPCLESLVLFPYVFKTSFCLFVCLFLFPFFLVVPLPVGALS